MFPHYFQVVKVVEVEVVETMKAATVESTVMTTMIWILNLHLAVPHLAVLVEIGLFVCFNFGFTPEYCGDFIQGYHTQNYPSQLGPLGTQHQKIPFLKFIHMILTYG